jgi:hypothetical protein
MGAIQIWPPPGEGGKPVKGPFSDMQGVRVIGHPAEYESRRYHAQSGAKWAHSHVIPEDAPFDEKQGLGAHIDKWHTPPYGEEKEQTADV